MLSVTDPACEPRPACLGAIYQSHIGRVYVATTCHDAAGIEIRDEFTYEELVGPVICERGRAVRAIGGTLAMLDQTRRAGRERRLLYVRRAAGRQL